MLMRLNKRAFSICLDNKYARYPYNLQLLLKIRNFAIIMLSNFILKVYQRTKAMHLKN